MRRANGSLISESRRVVEPQNGDAFWPNAFDQFVHDSRSGIVRDSEVDLEALDQVEGKLATAVEPLALTPARAECPTNFGHLEMGQVQDFGGFGKTVEGGWLDYKFDSLHLRTQGWPTGDPARYVGVNA